MKSILVASYFLISLLINAQPIQENLVKDVAEYFDSFNTNLLTPLVSNKNINLSIFSTKDATPTHYLDSLYQTQLNTAKKDIGLKLKFNSRVSFGNDITSLNDSAQLSKYQVKAGVQWNIFKEGYKNSQLNQSILQNKQLIQRLNEQLNEHEFQYVSRYQTILQYFHQGMKQELTVHITLLQKQLKLFTSMYYLHLVPYSRILELKKQIETIELELSHIPSSDDFPLSKERLPIQNISQWEVFDINLEQLLYAYKSNTISDSILTLEKENLHHQFKKQNLINFNLFAEYQVKTTTQNQTLLNSFIGGNLTIPLATSKKQKQQTVYYEEKILEEALLAEKDQTVHQIKTYYEEYQKSIQKIQDLYYQLFIELENLKTQTFIKDEVTPLSPTSLASFQHQNRILSIRKEMIQTKKTLYLTALKIFTLAHMDEKDLATESIIQKIQWKDLYHSNIILILNTDKALDDIHFFIHYLKRKEFKKIYVTSSSHDRDNLTQELLKMEGFTLVDNIEDLPIISIKQYSSSLALFQAIEAVQTPIVIDDLHDLIQLEQHTLQKQWQ